MCVAGSSEESTATMADGDAACNVTTLDSE